MESSTAKEIRIAPLFRRFFAALTDFAICTFSIATLYTVSQGILKNTKFVKEPQSLYENYAEESGLFSKKDDLLLIPEFDTYKDYENLAFSFYSNFVSKYTDQTIFDEYWFNVHIYGLKDELNKFDDEDDIPSLFKNQGSLLFSYKIVDSVPSYNEIAIPKASNNGTIDFDNFSQTEKDALLNYYFLDDVALSQQSENDLYVYYYLLLDFHEIPKVSNAYDLYYKRYITIPLVCSIISCLLIFYLAIPLLFNDGETLAKRMFKICLVNSEDYKILKYQILLRFFPSLLFSSFIYLAIGFNVLGVGLIVAVFLSSYLFSIFDTKHRMFHDLFALTKVIDKTNSIFFRNKEDELKFAELLNEKN